MDQAGFLELPLSCICGVTYTDSNREIDDLEWSFIKEISKQTGFYMMGIHISKAQKSRYSRKIDYFEFEFEGNNYILEKGKLKKDSD